MDYFDMLAFQNTPRDKKYLYEFYLPHFIKTLTKPDDLEKCESPESLTQQGISDNDT